MNGLKVVSLFAGVAGIDLAAERAGMETALLCEKDKACRNVLAERFPKAMIHDDVRTLTADDIRASGAVPGRTVVTAGWPCQGNSVAGNRGGMGDPRSGLWSHVARILDEFRPLWFVGENVPGLLSVSDGRDFATVIQDLADLGYGFGWRVLDARWFGVPQRRRRVILVGHLGGTGATSGEILFESEGVRRDSAPRGQARPSTATRARESVAVSGYDVYNDSLTGEVAHILMSVGGRNNRLPHVVGVLGDHTHALTSEGADAGEDGTGRGTPIIAFAPDEAATITAGVSRKGISTPGRRQEDDTNLIAYAPDTAHSLMSHGGNDKHDPTMMPYVAHEVQSLTAGGGERGYRIRAEEAAGGQLVAHRSIHENQRGELTLSDTMGALKTGGGKPGRSYPAVIAPTLLGSMGSNVGHAGDAGKDELILSVAEASMVVRRLTPLECERLQGLPDTWTLVAKTSDSQRYRETGNSVAVPVLEWVLRGVVAVDAAVRAA